MYKRQGEYWVEVFYRKGNSYFMERFPVAEDDVLILPYHSYSKGPYVAFVMQTFEMSVWWSSLITSVLAERNSTPSLVAGTALLSWGAGFFVPLFVVHERNVTYGKVVAAGTLEHIGLLSSYTLACALDVPDLFNEMGLLWSVGGYCGGYLLEDKYRYEVPRWSMIGSGAYLGGYIGMRMSIGIAGNDEESDSQRTIGMGGLAGLLLGSVGGFFVPDEGFTTGDAFAFRVASFMGLATGELLAWYVADKLGWDYDLETLNVITGLAIVTGTGLVGLNYYTLKDGGMDFWDAVAATGGAVASGVLTAGVVTITRFNERIDESAQALLYIAAGWGGFYGVREYMRSRKRAKYAYNSDINFYLENLALVGACAYTKTDVALPILTWRF